MAMKRESPSEEKHSPKDDRFPPPGLIAVTHAEELIHRPPIEAHPMGPPLTPKQQQQQDGGGEYHPVRRRGEAAAMVDIGHGKEDLGYREFLCSFVCSYCFVVLTLGPSLDR